MARERPGIATVAALLAAAVWFPACDDESRADAVLVPEAASPVALVALAGGGLRYAERLTGRVREVDPSGHLRPEPVAEVDVSTEGQRGLLGLAVDGRDRTFAAWTDPAGTILVGQVSPPPLRVLWRGPASAPAGNGGHVALAPDGRLVVSVGDRQQGDRSGRLLAVDPDGAPDQEAPVISTGWNNPFAFGFSPGGSLWIADNAPGEEPERLVRLDPSGAPVFAAELPGAQIAPAGLVALSDSHVVLCAYLTGELVAYDVLAGSIGSPRRLARGCRTSVARLPSGDLVYAGEDEIRVHEAPPERAEGPGTRVAARSREPGQPG